MDRRRLLISIRLTGVVNGDGIGSEESQREPNNTDMSENKILIALKLQRESSAISQIHVSRFMEEVNLEILL